MADSYDSYVAAVRGEWTGWWVVWPLSRRVRVGDVYDVVDSNLRSAGDLASRGISFECEPGAPPSTYTCDSAGTAKVRFKVAGSSPEGFSALVAVDAGALVTFDRASSVLVAYRGLTQQGMSDTRSVAAELARRYWAGSWEEQLVAVTDVVRVAAGTVLAAAGKGASAELRAGASVGPVALIDLAGDVTVAMSSSVGLQWVGSEITPFHRVVRLRRTWLDRIVNDYGAKQPGRGAAPMAIPPIVVEEARDDPDSVLESVPAAEQQPFEPEAFRNQL